MTKSSTFFSEAQRAAIEGAVRAAEAKTSGEIVPMVVDAAYDYPRAEIVGGGCFALAAAVTLSWAFGGSSLWVFLPLFLGLYLPCKWLIRFSPPLKRRLIHSAELAAEVEEKALVSFVEQGLHHTRDKTGILILICLFEHRVFVLADKGINDVVPLRTWDEIVQLVTAGIRQGSTAEGLIAAIGRCGALLEQNFPRKSDDTDELPNLIV